MQQILAQIETYLRGAWRFRWQAMLAAWAIAAVGWMMVYSMPDVYEARAKVYVDTDSVLRPLLSGLAVNTDVMNQVNMMSAVLLSRPNLETVARETDLYLRTKTPEDFENLVTQLPARITLRGGGRDSTYSLTYSDGDRNMAHRVVQVLLNTFVEDTLGLKRSDANSAQRFLEEQIGEYDKRLKDAETRLAEFKQRNFGMMPGEAGDYYTRLQSSITVLEDLRAKHKLVSERRAELRKQLEGEEPTFGIVSGPSGRLGPASPFDAKISEHQKRLDNLLLQYTEKHPDVIALRETIAQLEQQKQSSVATPGTSAGESVDPARLALRALDINPVYQNMKLQLAQAEVELAELRSQLAEQERTVRDLKARVDTIPEVEAQLVQLNRDYDVIRAQHTALLQRLESARLSEDAERNSRDVKFRIIEPPSVPLRPSGPDRGMFLTVVLLFSLVTGLALAIVLDQLRPVFTSRSVLRAVTGLPVLGSVQRVALPAVVLRERRQRLLLAGSLGLLLVTYLVGLNFVDTVVRATRALLS